MNEPSSFRFNGIETPCPKCGELVHVERWGSYRFYTCSKCDFEESEVNE